MFTGVVLRSARYLFCGSPHRQSDNSGGTVKCCVARRGWRKYTVNVPVNVSSLLPLSSQTAVHQLYSTFNKNGKDGIKSEVTFYLLFILNFLTYREKRNPLT